MTNPKKLRLNSTHGLKPILIILALACCGYAYSPVRSAPSPTRDWTKYPAVVEVDTEEDFAAVSDPHGEYDKLLRVLSATGWVSTDGVPKWTESDVPGGKRSVLIVVGDLIDKGDNSLKVIELLRALQKDASAQGGRVIVTMGNHEAEFLANWNGEKTSKFRNELKRWATEQKLPNPESYPEHVANCEGDLGQWLCQLPIAVRVNDWFFCHAGNTKGRNIQDLSSAIARGFEQSRKEGRSGFNTPELIGDDSILEAKLDKGKTWWFMNSEKRPEVLLRDYADLLKVNHIVMGHKPGNVDFPKPAKDFPKTGDASNPKRDKGDMFQAYNGLLFLIDTNMSESDIGASLYIKGPRRQKSDYNGYVTAFVNCPNPKLYGTPPLWDSSKPVAFNGLKCTDK